MTPNRTPIPTPPAEERETPAGINWKLFIAAAGIAVLLVGASMIHSGKITIPESVSSLGYQSKELPTIAINPPNETERERLADTLVEQGYKPEEIGKIEEHYLKDKIPEMIPISESVLIQNLEIIGNDEVRFTVKNVAEESVSTPFYTVDAQIFVKHPTTGKPTVLELRQMTWVEIGEEEMEPGEEREIVIENLFEKLDYLGYEEYYNISSVMVIYEEFVR